MAKVIEGANGERIIVGDDVPEDIQYDDGGLDRHLTSVVLNQLKTNSGNVLDPASLFLYFKETIIPVHLVAYTQRSKRIQITGTMLSNDFAWLLENKVETVNEYTIGFKEKEVAFKDRHKILSIRAKDMNAIAVTVNLSLERNT